MSLKKLEVFGLFGHFNHVIPLDNPDRITIITAPNGYGKTMILRIIDAIFNKRNGFLASLDFSRIELTIEDRTLVISRSLENELEPKLTYSMKESPDLVYSPEDRSRTLWRGRDFFENLPWISRFEENSWYDAQEGDVIGFEEGLERYSDHFPPSMMRRSSKKVEYPDWLKKQIEDFKVHLILDQRLILRANIGRRSPKSESVDAIEKFAKELASDIQRTSTQYSDTSQKLDRSFPSRLVLMRSDAPNRLDPKTLLGKLTDLRIKSDKLSEHGLIASEQHSAFFSLTDIKQEDEKVLSLYAEDTSEKLQVFDDMLARIELFTEILNEKRLSFKRVKINRGDGFLFETDKGKPLQLTQLSSGEQHEVVLLFELIFRAKDNTLILIDEPEISLHIAWQKEFLNDLRRIIDLQKVSVIISTHSPQIINENWNLTVDLGMGD